MSTARHQASAESDSSALTAVVTLLTLFVTGTLRPFVTTYARLHQRWERLQRSMVGAGDGEVVTVASMGVLARYAISLLVTLIVLLVAILVGGKFAGAIPTDNTFSAALTTTTDTAGTAFEIFGVTLIVLPGVAAIALIVQRLVGSGGGMMGGR